MRLCRALASLCVSMILLAGPAALAVNIETVTVGDPGNVGDSRYGGYGSVPYTYNIGKYEVTAGQYCEFLNKVAATDTYGLYDTGMADTSDGSGISRSGPAGSYTYGVAAVFVNRPVNFVSYWDALRFTNWLHNGQPSGAQGAGTTETGAYTLNGYNGTDGQAIQRAPGARWAVTSENEWYKAAYYNPAASGYYDYPTASNTTPGRDVADSAGNNANYWSASGPFPIVPGKYTTLVGEFQNSESPYGTFDQGGNLGEWNESIVAIVLQDPLTWAYRGSRGGSWFGYDNYMRASYRERYLSPAYADRETGFRVSEVPEPTSLALVTLGGVGMLVRRRGLGR